MQCRNFSAAVVTMAELLELKEHVCADDVRCQVEVVQVWEDARPLFCFQSQPLCDGQHHAFPGKLWDEAPTASVLRIALGHDCGVAIEDAAALDAAADNHVVTSPTVVAATTVGGQRAAKV